MKICESGLDARDGRKDSLCYCLIELSGGTSHPKVVKGSRLGHLAEEVRIPGYREMSMLDFYESDLWIGFSEAVRNGKNGPDLKRARTSREDYSRGYWMGKGLIFGVKTEGSRQSQSP